MTEDNWSFFPSFTDLMYSIFVCSVWLINPVTINIRTSGFVRRLVLSVSP